jgi:4-nitrophenyl phosphatase
MPLSSAAWGLAVDEPQILTSGEATAIYIHKLHPAARLYLVGTPSLEEEFRTHGFNLVDEKPDFVVLGFDTTLTYAKLERLCRLCSRRFALHRHPPRHQLPH